MWKTHRQLVQENVLMLSLKWGDVLSTLLPGGLALFAVSSWYPVLNGQIKNPAAIGVAGGFLLLMASALFGGILEAITRITWEKYWLVWRCPPKSVLSKLDASNVALYDRGVEGSYKYVTFYANLALATILLLVSRLHDGQEWCAGSSILLVVVIGVLFRASHVQWTYYVNYQNKVFGEDGKYASK
jgi:hypothetical protein